MDNMNFTFKAWKRPDGMVEWAMARKPMGDCIEFSGGVMTYVQVITYLSVMKMDPLFNNPLAPCRVGFEMVKLAANAPAIA